MVVTIRVMAPSLVFRGKTIRSGRATHAPPLAIDGYTPHPAAVNQKVASPARKFALDHWGLALRGEHLRSAPRAATGDAAHRTSSSPAGVRNSTRANDAGAPP